MKVQNSIVYMYDCYVKDTFDKKAGYRSEVFRCYVFYERMMQNYKLQVGTVDKIHTLIHLIFKLTVRNSIIRINPADGCMIESKKKSSSNIRRLKVARDVVE